MSYISNKLSKSKIKKVIPPKTALKTIKTENNKMPKKSSNQGGKIPCVWDLW